MGVGALSDSLVHAWIGISFFALVQKAKSGVSRVRIHSFRYTLCDLHVQWETNCLKSTVLAGPGP